MAPPSTKPKLSMIDPAALALDIAQRMRDHLQSQLIALSPMGDIKTIDLEDDDLRMSELYRAVRMLTGYARGDHGLDAPVHEYLISLIPLWKATLGDTDADGLASDADPDTEIGTVICASLGRERISDGEPLIVVQLAALAGLSRRAVQLLIAKGELPGDDDGVGAKDAKRWLAARGVPGFEARKRSAK